MGYLCPLALRFFLASLFLFLYGIAFKKPLKLSLFQHRIVLLQSLLLFSLNFVAIYSAAQFLMSGFNAMISATVTFFNVINTWLLLRQPLKLRPILASLMGFSGLFIALSLDLNFFDDLQIPRVFLGMGLSLLGAYLTSIGQVLVGKRFKQDISPLAMNCYGMLYGSMLVAAIALIRGDFSKIQWSAPSAISILYLALIPSALGFLLYFQLIRRVGPRRAGFVFIIAPGLALFLSQLFEGYVLKGNTIIGLLIILISYGVLMQEDQPIPKDRMVKSAG